jgi:tetratricopeptide (TPR) repeat protein
LEKNSQPPPEVLLARALIHARLGQLLPAIDMFSAKLRLTPNDTPTRSQRGWTYLHIDSPRQALADFDACLKEDRNSADFLIGRGLAHLRLKHLREALDDAAKAGQQEGLPHRLLYNLAGLYAQAGVQVEAELRARRDPLASRGAEPYHERACESLRRALAALPEDRRAAFWRDQVQVDPLLAPLRGEPLYKRMAERYGPGKVD